MSASRYGDLPSSFRLHSVRAELHPPHEGECECWQCAEWRLRHAALVGWDVLYDAIFKDETGAPALRLLSGADAPDEGSIDGDKDAL